MLWVYKDGGRGWTPNLQWSFFENEIAILNTNANKPCNDLCLVYKYPRTGHWVCPLHRWKRITVWFRRRQASFKEAYSVVDNQVQVALNPVELIFIGPKSVLGKIYTTVCRLLQYTGWLRNIFSLFISKDNFFYTWCLGTFEDQPAVLAAEAALRTVAF